MPLVQGGPPQWIWERTPDPLRIDVSDSRSLEGNPVSQLTIRCGFDIVSLHSFTRDELQELYVALGDYLTRDD